MLTPYAGEDKVTIANGTGMEISNIGSSSFNCNNKILYQDLLHILETSTNLLSFKKYCEDNNVWLEFDVSKVLVKDRDTNEVLMKGGTQNSLYTLQHSSAYVPHYAFLCERATLNR